MNIFDLAAKNLEDSKDTKEKIFDTEYQPQIEKFIVDASKEGYGSILVKLPDEITPNVFSSFVKEKIDSRLTVIVTRENKVAEIFGWDGAKKTTTIIKRSTEVKVLKAERKYVIGRKQKRIRVKFIEVQPRPSGASINDYRDMIAELLIKQVYIDDIAVALHYWQIDEIETYIKSQFKDSAKGELIGGKLPKIVTWKGKEYIVRFPPRQYLSSCFYFYGNIVKEKYEETKSISLILVMFNNHRSFNLKQTVVSNFLKSKGVDIRKGKH